MGAFDRIVVGVDGTDYGFEALHQTLALAPGDAAVDAITVLDAALAVHAGFDLSHVLSELEAEAERTRARAREILEGRADCTATIVRGDVKRTLGHACASRDASLLALGGRNSSRFLGILLGETATTFVHEGAVSVLLARIQWGQRWRPDRIVVGVDGSEPSLAALAVADELSSRLGAGLSVTSATGGKQVDRAGDWAARVDDWNPEHPVAALLNRSLSADLIVLGSRGLHGLRALGSVSERVAHRARCSVLIVQGGASVEPRNPDDP